MLVFPISLASSGKHKLILGSFNTLEPSVDEPGLNGEEWPLVMFIYPSYKLG